MPLQLVTVIDMQAKLKLFHLLVSLPMATHHQGLQPRPNLSSLYTCQWQSSHECSKHKPHTSSTSCFPSVKKLLDMFIHTNVHSLERCVRTRIEGNSGSTPAKAIVITIVSTISSNTLSMLELLGGSANLTADRQYTPVGRPASLWCAHPTVVPVTRQQQTSSLAPSQLFAANSGSQYPRINLKNPFSEH